LKKVNIVSYANPQAPRLLGTASLGPDGGVLISRELAPFLSDLTVVLSGEPPDGRPRVVTPVDGEDYLRGLMDTVSGVAISAEDAS
jgi:hypothetical protein